MKLPLSWLSEYVELPATEKLVERLNETGTSVEAIQKFGAGLDKIIVGEILDVIPHPNADKLQVARVRIPGKDLNIVCGAPNISSGQKVPVAQVGVSVPKGPDGNPLTIEKRKIREVESEGMLCSARELGLGENHEGILILDPNTKVGESLGRALNLPDTVIDTEVTPNRGDKLSVHGTAREISAITSQRLRNLNAPDLSLEGKGVTLSAEITNPKLARRYGIIAVGGIKIGPSPAYIQSRLSASGMRPINNVVDITNYVMMLIGQPLHAFDAEKVAGRKLIVRSSKPHERFTTLDGAERELPNNSVVIADSEKAIALGGIMGGQNSAVSDETSVIILESAVFDPVAIRRTSMSLGLNSDASHRFQRHVDPSNSVLALQLAVDLLKKHASGFVASKLVDLYPDKVKETKVTLPKNRLDQYLGYEMTINQAAQTLEHLGYKVTNKSEKELTVAVPSWREHDVEIPEDLIEDIASLAGYDKIPDVLPTGVVEPFVPEKTPGTVKQTKDHLTSLGLNEVYTYSMTSQDLIGEGRPLKIANPTSKEWEFMRTTLTPSLAQTLQQNLSWGVENDLFELSRVYLPKEGDLPHENLRLAFSAPNLDTAKGYLESVLARLNINAPTYLENKKGEAAGVSASIKNQSIGVLGYPDSAIKERSGLKRDRVLAEIDFEKIIELANPPCEFKLPPKYPDVHEDISVVVEGEVTVREVIDATKGASGLLRSVDYISSYTGEGITTGKKAITLGLTFRSDEKTLTAEEVKQAREQIVGNLKKELQATLR